MPDVWIAGRVVGVNAPGMDLDKAAELASVFAGFQALNQQINGEFFEWIDDADAVSNAELLTRTRSIVDQASN